MGMKVLMKQKDEVLKDLSDLIKLVGIQRGANDQFR